MEKFAHYQGNGKPTSSGELPATGNGKTEHKQRSFSMSSCESNSDFIKMPILNTSYGSSLSVSNPSTGNHQGNSQKRSAGDVLLSDLKPPPSPTQKSASLKRRSSCRDDCKDTVDVVDSVPTRRFKADTLIDHSTLDRQQNGSTKSVKQPTSSEDDRVPQAEPTPSCCDVFCALFLLKYIFSRYTIIDLMLNIGSIALYFFDLITDWLNAFGYLERRNEIGEEDNLFYFSLTVVVIVLPSIVIHAFSIWWEIEDKRHIQKEKKKRELENKFGCCYFTWVAFSHLFQLAPVYRYIRTIYYGMKSRYKEVSGKEDRWMFYDRKYKGELADVNFIRLMESFLEAAPQLVLQIYIMIRTVQTPFITVLSVSVSLGGMAIAFVAYQRALRNSLEHKHQLSLPATIVLLLFRSLTILSRVFAMALLLNTNVWAWIGFFLGHWFVMSFLIAVQKTEFCATKAKEYIYDVVIGFCYTFAYINVHFGSRNRYRMLAYYMLTLLENTAMALCWFYLRRGGGGSILDTIQGVVDDVTEEPVEEGALSNNIALTLVVVVIGLFVLGMLCFLIYYIWLHPKAQGVRFCISGGHEYEGKEDLNEKEATLRPSCGDNYRTHRGAPQFRSWHSASINYTPDINKLTEKKKRPSSEIISQSPSMLYDVPVTGSSTLNLQSDNCSCYSMRNELASGPKVLNSKSSTSRAPQKLPHQRSSTTSYREAILNSEPGKEERTCFNEAERKRRHVSELLEQKQREKRELEQAMLRHRLEHKQRHALQVQNKVQRSDTSDNGFEVHDLFNRKQRAMHMYSPKSKKIHVMVTRTASSIPLYLQTIENKSNQSTPVAPSPPVEPLPSSMLMPLSENQNASNSTYRSRFVASGGGTFPRCSRAGHVNRQSGRTASNSFQRGGSLKPISEVGFTDQLSIARNSTASLVNLAFTRHPIVRAVPRAMSFTISKNEVVESMESSL